MSLNASDMDREGQREMEQVSTARSYGYAMRLVGADRIRITVRFKYKRFPLRCRRDREEAAVMLRVRICDVPRKLKELRPRVRSKPADQQVVC